MLKKGLFIVVASVLMVGGIRLSAQVEGGGCLLRSGDLLFVSDGGAISQAVRQSTGCYSHVALVERVGDSLFVIDATPAFGVARRPIGSLADRQSAVDAYRLNIPFDTAAVIARAHALVGLSYDAAFLPDNGAYYCSELIQAVFLVDGKPIFASSPMNWRDGKGRMPRYWKRHFRKLGMKVPEGLPGTNPTALSLSPLLRRL